MNRSSPAELSASARAKISAWSGERPQAGSVAAASPANAKAWHRQPPQSVSRRSQERPARLLPAAHQVMVGQQRGEVGGRKHDFGGTGNEAGYRRVSQLVHIRENEALTSFMRACPARDVQ